jgi:serine/threonine protein kinase
MSSVWRGRDQVLQRDVALKPLGLQPGKEAPDLARAEREARLAARLDHAHVVAVFDLLEDNGEQWLVMELVNGRNLAQLVAEHGPLPPDGAARLLGQAADALAAAHRSGIVHRDVKPSNILVTPEGQVKLTDFGIARAYSDPTLTATGLMTGSPAYLAPELASGSPATAASDVWALGATLFHALTGEPPYDARGNVMGALYRIVNEEPPRPQQAGWLAPVLEHTMAKDPADRWSMADVRDRLLRRTDDDTPTRRVPVTPPVAPPAARPVAPPASQTTTQSATRSPTRSVSPPATPPATPPAAASVSGLREAPPERPGGQRGGQRGGRPGVLALALLALLVAALVGGTYLLVNRDSGGSQTPTAGGSDATSDPSTSPSPSPSEPSETPSPTKKPKPTLPPATENSMEDFVESYLETVTENPRAAFRMLTPAYQRASGGFRGYNGFWSTIADADPGNIEADPDRLTISYEVDYERTDGSETEEAITLQLRRTRDGYLIAGQRG